MADRALLARVARLYYEEGLTHAEIAPILSLSRVKVTRLLAEARHQKIVEITVHSDEPAFADLERRLATSLGLRAVWIGPRSTDPSALGRAGARAIRELLPGADRVTVGLSGSVRAAVEQLRGLSLPHLDVFPAGGGRPGPISGADPQDVAAALARIVRASAVFGLPAPLLAADRSSAQSLLADPHLRCTLGEASRADLLMVGVGSLDSARRYWSPRVDDAVFDDLDRRGARGDISARFFGEDGTRIASPLDDRVIGLSLEQMRSIPTRLVIAGGTDKVDAIRIAVASGLANTLVTDNEVAERLLAHP